MADLTLNEYKGFSEKGLKRVLETEALKIFGFKSLKAQEINYLPIHSTLPLKKERGIVFFRYPLALLSLFYRLLPNLYPIKFLSR